MINSSAVVSFASQQVTKEGDPPAVNRVVIHVDVCPDSPAVVEAYREFVESFRQAPVIQIVSTTERREDGSPIYPGHSHFDIILTPPDEIGPIDPPIIRPPTEDSEAEHTEHLKAHSEVVHKASTAKKIDTPKRRK